MSKVTYRLEDSGDFVIENYNRAKAFSSFFPGIAGLYGIPMWVFYVNRGQCISACGVQNKDGAILEFYPANQAYHTTQLKGFRTVIKIQEPKRLVYEPFRNAGCPFSNKAARRMIINPYMLSLEEENPQLGLRFDVNYMTVPQEPFAGLIRRLTVTNTSDNVLSAELIDGLPYIIPYGVNTWCQKNMSRTIEAWMQVTNLDKNIPFYALKVDPQDRPELVPVERGNFYLAYELSLASVRQLGAIIDPDILFGKDADLNFPIAFYEQEKFRIPKSQRLEGKTPCAFTHTAFKLTPKKSIQIISVLGNTRTKEEINRHSARIISPDFFDKKLTVNRDIISGLENTVFSKSARPEFDSYLKQTFLDNLLRGGFAHSIKASSGDFVYYLYARKHGDLERDYNNFMLNASYFSQGNGAYRDINQNRRNDVFFNPKVKEENIHTFVDALSADGFNPLHIQGSILSVEQKDAAGQILKKYIPNTEKRKKLEDFLSKKFKLGDLAFFLEREGIIPKKDIDLFLKSLLGNFAKEDVFAEGPEGYWVDHWTYNLDLIESYLAVYPDKTKQLLIGKKDFTFFDSCNRVLPRSQKYVLVNGKVRQFGSVTQDKTKKAIIESRTNEAQKVRTEHGRGKVYRTTLTVKLLTLFANKAASLDPFGVGIEMEANKPGWCDALNNLPGIFGSSVSETIELKRLVAFLREAIEQSKLSRYFAIVMPEEIAGFLNGLSSLFKSYISSRSKNKDFTYWDRANTLKEKYRQNTWTGFSGKERTMTVKAVQECLNLAAQKIDMALEKSIDKASGIPCTYYFHQAKSHKIIKEKKRPKLNIQGYPLVDVLSFSQRPVAHFLEAPMHMMRVLDGQDNRRRLYEAIKESGLYDKKLNMYKLNVSLAKMPFEIGRSTVFTPGWLENESIWLHMEYKYLLEVLRAGLYHEFFADIQSALVPFMDPNVYGRSILENSSFIVSSAHPQEDIWGSGFVARLSGATTEFMSMWLHMAFGKAPFCLDERDRLSLVFKPVLPKWLFTEKEEQVSFAFEKGKTLPVKIPKDSFAFVFLGRTLVIYRNPKRKDLFCQQPDRVVLSKSGEKDVVISGGIIHSRYAKAVREGRFEQIEAVFS
ncbi:MAG: hypothetical protein JW869_07125 [Candidatus Omnitrophica bacterium]|nr:hypothetical protein [Candidatus Omnitrophota bacterium]